jgi:hypothetical protein
MEKTTQSVRSFFLPKIWGKKIEKSKRTILGKIVKKMNKHRRGIQYAPLEEPDLSTL